MLAWVSDIKKGKLTLQTGIVPAYGKAVDEAVHAAVMRRNSSGLPIDSSIVRNLLIIQLQKAGKDDLLSENGGKYVFGKSWAARFMKRWKLVRRVATTKMREKPADFNQKVEEYVRIGAAIVCKHNIPPELVIACDETGCVFVPKSKYTVAMKGARKIRLLGVGKDKEQFTVTIFCTESGCILPAQMIFGGKTAGCHPGGGRTAPPVGIFWDHSVSHWQTPETFAKAIENIVVPYKDAKIAELGLPAGQHCMLKMDLHYSHKVNPANETPGSLLLKETLQRHRIVPFYVPGACTDELQECDTILNKTFKVGVKNSFRDYLHSQFNDWVRNGRDPDLWVPNFGLSTLKPRITGWVQAGLAMISTPQMTTGLSNAFNTDSRFEEIRSPERQRTAQLEQDITVMNVGVRQLQIEDEPDNCEEIAAGGDLVNEDFVEPDADSDVAAETAAAAGVPTDAPAVAPAAIAPAVAAGVTASSEIARAARVAYRMALERDLQRKRTSTAPAALPASDTNADYMIGV